MNYEYQIKDQRWIDKAAEIKKRDNYTCQICGSDKQLNVHHTYYINGLDYWEYNDDMLITLCQPCHKKEHKNKTAFNEKIKGALRSGMLYKELIKKLKLE